MTTPQSRGLTATFIICIAVLTWLYGLTPVFAQETLVAFIRCIALVAASCAIMLDIRHGENLLTSALWVLGCGVFTFGAFWSIFW